MNSDEKTLFLNRPTSNHDLLISSANPFNNPRVQERREAVEQSEIAQTVVPIQNHSKSVSALLVPPLVCLSICAIAGLTIYLKQALTWKDIKGRFQSFRQSKQIPCKKCRFLCNNKYIKCAVHPYKALTISARNCPDFWDRDSNHFSK